LRSSPTVYPRLWLVPSVLILVSLACMSGAADLVGEPAPTEEPAGEVLENSGTELPSAIPEMRRLVLEWPGVIRIGDSDLVRLVLEIDKDGLPTSTAVFLGNELSSERFEIPNVYETHNILAEARLEMAGVKVAPADLVSQPMQPGDRVEFIWSVKPEGVGTLRGTMWLYLRFIPKDGGQESKSTLAAKTIEVRAANLLGLSGTSARLLGIAGMVVGSFLGLDNLLPWGWKLLRRLFARSNG